jgi:hypothetical protein
LKEEIDFLQLRIRGRAKALKKALHDDLFFLYSPVGSLALGFLRYVAGGPGQGECGVAGQGSFHPVRRPLPNFDANEGLKISSEGWLECR